MDKNLEKYLKEKDITFIEHKHKPIFRVEEGKKLKKLIPAVHTKCLFLKDNNEKFYLLCTIGEKRVDMKNLRINLGVKKLHFASFAELKQHLNVNPGSVSIFGMIYSKEVILVIDKEIWESNRTGFHPNINTSTLEIDHKNLEKFINNLQGKKLIIQI